MRRILIYLFIAFFLGACSSGGKKRQKAPGADVLKVHLLESIRMLVDGEYDSANRKLLFTDSLARVYGNRFAQASVLSNYGWLAAKTGLLDSAIHCYEGSIEIQREVKDSTSLMNNLEAVARVYRDRLEFGRAAEALEESIGWASILDDSLMIVSSANLLGGILIELLDYERAFNYYEIAADGWLNNSDTANYSIALHNKGDALRGMGRLEAALQTYSEALKVKRQLKRISSSAYTLTGMGRTYILLDSIGKAEEVLTEAVNIRKPLSNKTRYAETLLILSRVSVAKKQYRKAERQLREVEKIAVDYNKADLLRDAFEDQRALYKAWGKLGKLAIVDESYDIMTDSLYREEKLKVQEAQSAASLQREQQKTLLAEQNVKFANLELQAETQKSQFWLILGVIAMLGLMVIAWQLLQIRKQNAALVTLNSRIKLITDNAFHSQKNALGLISALLRSKARQTDHEKELEVLKDVEGKIEALGGVAKSLFQRRIEDNTAVAARIQLKSYLEELVDDTFSSVASQADLDLSVEDIETTSTEALNIGLITNEAVTNFSKYAESDGADTLLIRVTKEGGMLHLSFTDNGPGFPKDFDFSSSTGFGMQMMANLVEDMDGRIEIKREDDLTLIEVEIPLKA